MALQPPQTSHLGAHRDILEGRAPLIPTPGTAAFCCSASLTNTQPPNYVLSPGSPAADGVVLGQLLTEPFIVREMPHSLNHLCGSVLDSLKEFLVLLELRGPECPDSFSDAVSPGQSRGGGQPLLTY